MVLESLIGPVKAEKKFWELFFFGVLYSSIAVILALWIFKDQSSLIVVFLTVLATVPLMYRTIKFEEKKDLKIQNEVSLLKAHSRALAFFMFLFMGITIAFSLWYTFLPEELVNTLFSTQVKTIESINAQILRTGISSLTIAQDFYMQILSNNFKVLLFSIFFSFFYGAGAIFILTWNASVIASAIGIFIRRNLSELATSFGLGNIASYFQVFSIGTLRYMTHGTFEILAYFIGGLAGGLISVAIIRHNIDSKEFRHVLIDSIDLTLLAVAILVVAAFVEVYITPSLF
ncbi:MAG: stage II sporulation protein M [Candidatus Nanoarchaeia archaeon]|jgi:uncharacterized membrane protein SpoIIM required for sporulation|nr:stage II sporulation protein M [Candidatus Nanoarchaeia archaeon]|tara:strand:- start:6112 stop:6975 length:864 start_codon:yes stop_codon:yes gene_type:complete